MKESSDPRFLTLSPHQLISAWSSSSSLSTTKTATSIINRRQSPPSSSCKSLYQRKTHPREYHLHICFSSPSSRLVPLRPHSLVSPLPARMIINLLVIRIATRRFVSDSILIIPKFMTPTLRIPPFFLLFCFEIATRSLVTGRWLTRLFACFDAF